MKAMKKGLLSILTISMMVGLIGCSTNKDEVTIPTNSSSRPSHRITKAIYPEIYEK